MWIFFQLFRGTMSMNIQFKVFFHVLREGNHCIIKLANLAFIHIEQYKWFNVLPSSIYFDFFFHNRYSLLMFLEV